MDVAAPVVSTVDAALTRALRDDAHRHNSGSDDHKCSVCNAVVSTVGLDHWWQRRKIVGDPPSALVLQCHTPAWDVLGE
jgi:hypothetical protein